MSLGKIRCEENILWSFAPHDIAVILRMIGKLPLEVCACGGSYIQPDIADVTVTHLLFDNSVRAHIHVSWLHPFKEQRLVVIGSRKMASFDDVGKRLILYDQRVEIGAGGPVPIKGDGQEVPFSAEEPLRLECAAFLEAVQSRRPARTDGASGERVLAVLQAAQQSLSSHGRPVALPLEKSGGGLSAGNSPSDSSNRPYSVHPSAFVDGTLPLRLCVGGRGDPRRCPGLRSDAGSAGPPEGLDEPPRSQAVDPQRGGVFICSESEWRYQEVEERVLRCLDWPEDEPLP